MRIYLIILIIIISHSVSAQFKGGLDNFTILDLRIGGSFPMGSFSQTGQSNSVSGYATEGFNAAIGAYQSFNDFMGLGGTFTLTINGYDESARRRAIYNRNPSVQNAYVESTRYNTFTVTGGPNFFIRFSENIGFQLKTEAGMLQLIRPAQQFIITQFGQSPVTHNLERFGGSSFALYIGSTIRYHASESVGLSFYADYLYGKPNFEYLQNYPDWLTFQDRQQISMINLGLCLSYIVGY